MTTQRETTSGPVTSGMFIDGVLWTFRKLRDLTRATSGPAASVKEEVMSDEGRDIQQSSLEPNSAVTGDSPSGKRESEVSGPAASADDVIEFTTRLTTDPVTGEKRMLTTAGPAASAEPRTPAEVTATSDSGSLTFRSSRMAGYVR